MIGGTAPDTACTSAQEHQEHRANLSRPVLAAVKLAGALQFWIRRWLTSEQTELAGLVLAFAFSFNSCAAEATASLLKLLPIL